LPDPLRIDVWSDVVCPWCAIGRVRLAKALAADGVSAMVVHRAFELDPTASGTRPTHEVLHERYGDGADVEGITRRVRELARADGLDLRTDQALSANTFDAHRLLAWAQATAPEREAALMDALVRAHFTDLKDVADPEVLAAAATAAGLDAAAARRVLASDEFARAVRQDEAMARELGIHGVPFFVLDGRVGVSGAQPVEVFRKALRTALQRA